MCFVASRPVVCTTPQQSLIPPSSLYPYTLSTISYIEPMAYINYLAPIELYSFGGYVPGLINLRVPSMKYHLLYPRVFIFKCNDRLLLLVSKIHTRIILKIRKCLSLRRGVFTRKVMHIDVQTLMIVLLPACVRKHCD